MPARDVTTTFAPSVTFVLARAATARDAPLRPFFTEGLSDPVRGYWSILGYIRVAGRLPAVYLDFVTRFSPLRVIIDSDIFVRTFLLFGAADLIEGQDGYSESSALKRRLEEWPPHLVVIGSDAGDPYVLDLSRSNG